MLSRPYDDKGKPKNLHYIADAIHISNEDFVPNYKNQPGAAFENASTLSASDAPFTLPESSAPRNSLELTGQWELAPWDEKGELTNASRVAGAEAYPPVETLHWYGYDAPNYRKDAVPEAAFAHRFVVRTYVDVPASFENDSAVLLFEMLNVINTLFVNGEKVGDFDIVEGQWQVDVSDYLRAGRPMKSFWSSRMPITRWSCAAKRNTSSNTIQKVCSFAIKARPSASITQSLSGITIRGLLTL